MGASLINTGMHELLITRNNRCSQGEHRLLRMRQIHRAGIYFSPRKTVFLPDRRDF